ncbi:hypothetical protein BGZ60DRAFT_217876 [Tricladium varicosporioides]|nr:hypothetical protein BGZ60DRAFT_217876 [Hymenoscyphus varicosporioides]
MAVENRGPQVAASAILFLTLSWIFVSLRCYVRTVLMKSFGADDWLAVAALILFTLYCAFVLLGVHYGTGQHLADLDQSNIPIAIKWWWCCELAYVSSTAVLKVSIGIFLMRICVKPMQRITIYMTMGIVTTFSIFYFFLIVFQCTPPTYFWTQYTGGKGTCLESHVIPDATYAHSAVSALVDWTLGILPIFLVWDLAMNPRTKIIVGVILGLGAIGSTATIVRIPYINQLSQGDFLYSTSDVAIWSTVEPGIGIVASSMATLRPLFRTFFARSKLFGSRSTPAPPSGSLPWPGSNRPTRGNYFRSGSKSNGVVDEELVLGLRSDIKAGAGVVTVVQGPSSEEAARRTKSSESLRWGKSSKSATGLGDDSSEEFLPIQQGGKGDWRVRKTMEVTTSQERSGGRG